MVRLLKQLITDAKWFRDQQKVLRLTNEQMAEALYCSLSHVEHMRSKRRPITKKTKQIIKLLIDGGKL